MSYFIVYKATNAPTLRPRLVAWSCNPAARRARLSDGVRLGVLSSVSLCRSGVRAKHGVDMVGLGEPGPTRSSKAERTGPGRKRSRQKLPHGAVVG
ncbi:hypothetical protein AVEN_162446-1 [Araneus ventricosus]|uniref:Uncharacterized protein n=1 Tax=Araneus ventricosus TaxID=182803 RepID=A0A4Y2N1H1_ARAVE|nr:hypothetical protein AVEN_162446-1 [Araneus ventricosus]